jgi:type II secretory pathway component GspD/PulD (secretin)
MKTMKNLILLGSFAVALLITATGQQPDTAKDDKQPAATTPNTGEQAPPQPADKPAAEAGGKAADNQPASPPTKEGVSPKNQAQPAEDPAAPAPEGKQTPNPAPATARLNGESGLRLNFRGVPLEMVLNYLSDAAGFIINIKPGTDVKGKVDVWSNQPLSKDEAVDLLNTVLNQNGFAAVRKERTLTIMSRKDAKTEDIPVRRGSEPKDIQKNDEMVTQIVPVRYANATQLTKDLLPLLPSGAEMTANESANALVITDTQANIRRMTEIVQALDTSISSISAVRVFPLKYADAKDLATAVKEVFQSPNQQNNNNPINRIFNRLGGGRGGGGGGPFPGGVFPGLGGDQANGTGTSEARTAASRVVAVADERSNSLVVSAPDEFIPTIEQLVKELDVSVSDITELRVFHLRNANAVEMADMFSQLFPDETKTGNDSNQNQIGFRFGGGGGGRNRNGNNQAETSERMKKKGRVLAVADERTSSIIVSAASELMPQIEEMVAQLDASPAKKQKVYIYSLENADAQQVQQVLQDMFQRNNTTMNRNNANQNSVLTNRRQNNNQGTATGNGNTGFGNSRGTTGSNQGGSGF